LDVEAGPQDARERQEFLGIGRGTPIDFAAEIDNRLRELNRFAQRTLRKNAG
jgi:hypothetical protein